MIHSSNYKPRVLPYGTGTAVEIDRLQDITGSTSLNREKINEIGRNGIVSWKTSMPTVDLSLRQYEYGTLEFFNKLANKADGTNKVELTDFKTSLVDLVAYKTDDAGTFLGTAWYPKCRTNGFSMNIGDPEALLERNFSLVCEDDIFLQGTNKYLIFLHDTTCSGAAHTIVIGSGDWANYPDPVLDPDNSGSYILKLVRVRSGVSTEMVLGTDYTYSDDATTITLIGAASAASDVFKVWYSAASYITGSTPFTNNDSDAGALEADYVSIYLVNSSNYIYRLQNVSIDVSFDRFDVKEIGNNESVLYGVRDTNVSITLGRSLEDYAIEEYLRGVASDYAKLDIRKLLTDTDLIVKIYSDEEKNDFRIGYKFTDLAPTGLDDNQPVEEYEGRTVTLEGQTGFVSTDHTDF